MASLSDQMLASGCVAHIATLHGEIVKVITGADAGKSFTAVNETENDILLPEALDVDHRGHRFLRFAKPNIPRLAANDVLQTADGQLWNAVVLRQNSYLTVDFELSQIAAKDGQ